MAEVVKQTAGTCPNLETIAAYLDGRLSDRERERVTEHLAACEECYELLRESAQTRVEDVGRVVSIETWRDRVLRPRVLWSSAAAAIAVAASLLVVIRGGMMSPRPDAQLRTLVQAAGTDRMIEARLSGGFSYGELRAPVRTSAPSSSLASPDLRIAAAGVEKSLAGVATPAALHAVGIASVLVGDLDRAIPMLEQGVSTSDVRTFSDLAAAYLARATRDGLADDLTRALAAADRAIAVDPALPEALFNRALALERLSRRDEARSAWRDYLRRDETSGWAREARVHLASLS